MQSDQDRWEINHADFVRARMGHHQGFTVSRPGDTPRIGGPTVHVIQQYGIQHLHAVQIDNGPGIGIDPTALDLGGGQVETREDVSDHGELAVRQSHEIRAGDR